MSAPAVVSGQMRYILVVDSDWSERFTLSMLLQKFGYTVASSNNAKEAVEFLCVAPAEAVFAEAGETGSELMRLLRSDSRFHDMPIVMVTDARDKDLESKRQKGSLAGLLRTPLDPQEVFQIIQKVLENGNRSNIRIPTAIDALLMRDADGVKGYVTVLSQLGMFFRTLDPLPVKTRIDVVLSLWDRALRLEAEVLYIVSFEEGPFCEPGMGMKFTRIEPEDSALIKHFIYEQLGVAIIPPQTGYGLSSGQA